MYVKCIDNVCPVFVSGHNPNILIISVNMWLSNIKDQDEKIT